MTVYSKKYVTLHLYNQLNKLINIASKEDNQVLIDHIERKKGKISEHEYSKFAIQPAYKRSDLADTVKVILDFNKRIQTYLT